MVVLTGVEQENIPHVLYLNTVSVILRVLLEPNDCSGYYGKKIFFFDKYPLYYPAWLSESGYRNAKKMNCMHKKP